MPADSKLSKLTQLRDGHRAAEKPVQADKPNPAGQGAASSQPPSRAGKSHIGAYFSPEVRRQLRQIAATHDKTQQQLMGEAINHLFAAYQMPEIADADQN